MAVIVAQIVVVALNLAWVALGLLAIPGTWLAIATAALCDWLTEPRLFHWGTYAAAVLIAIAGELWELLASAARARRAGAKRSGAIGALAGGMLGAILGTFLIPAPLFGTLAGGGIGAFLGSTLLEERAGRDLREALQVGRAAGVGHVLGQIGKLACGLAVWALLAVAVFVP